MESMRVTPQFYKCHNFWNFIDLSLGYNEEKSCNFLSLLAVFMKFQTIKVKIWSEHINIVILPFLGKKRKWIFNKNSFISQNYRSFIETRVMDTEHFFWKFELNQIIFLDFTRIRSLKCKEIRVSDAKLFLMSKVTKIQTTKIILSVYNFNQV